MDAQPFATPPVPSEDLPIEHRELAVGATGRKAWIVDNLVDPEALPLLHAHFRSLPYRFFDTDRADTEFVRHLVHYFDEEDYDGDPAVASLRAQATSLLQERGLAFSGIERIYANFNLHGDYQFTHADGDVWTALVFVNSRWSADWGGELMLYEDGPQPVALAIPPRPGRMVIFDGRIDHRGGAPSKFCVDARITLAMKFVKA